MDVLKSVAELEEWKKACKANRETIGFVPTMGALHDGHLSLVKQSKKRAQKSICSIFVNPTQFDRAEDLNTYPSNIEQDINLLKNVSLDAVFIPTVSEMYPNEIVKKGPEVDFKGIDQKMEGEKRPGHFQGVVSVVHRFFGLVTPDFTFFGLKDYQQFLIVKLLAQQHHKAIEVVGCEIIREQTGLAMSSRNERLSSSARLAAAKIFEYLKALKLLAKQVGWQNALIQIEERFNNNAHFELEYLTVVDANSLELPKKNQLIGLRAFVAVWCDGVRLIDNLEL